MNVWVLIGGVVLSAAVIAMFLAVVWCLVDVVFRARDIPLPLRVVWVLALLGLNVIAAIVYVRLGPGRRRWAPWRWWLGREASRT